MPLPLLAILGASLVIGTLVVVALLKWSEIVDWFRNRSVLKQSDKDNIAVMVRTQLASGHVREIHGIFNTQTEEVLDGQQRTLSVMQYLKHKFSITIDGKKYYWDALPDDKYNAIMNYEFMIYICEGEESEKLEWFKVVNIAGEKLSDQELRNSVYTGEWLSDAKLHFSKRNCAAKLLSDKYITGDPNRQELLEKALKGICENQGVKEITEYMAQHKSDKDADELWQYFQYLL